MNIKEMKVLKIGNDSYSIVDEQARGVNTIADMRALTNLKSGNIIRTLGYYSPNDGGKGTYLIREKNESDVIDNGAIHEITVELVAELIAPNGVVNVKQFGAIGDGQANDTQKLINAINYSESLIINCDLGVTDTILINKKIKIEGQNHIINFVGNHSVDNNTNDNYSIFDIRSQCEILNLTVNGNCNYLPRTLNPNSTAGVSYYNSRWRCRNNFYIEAENVLLKNVDSVYTRTGFLLFNANNCSLINCSSHNTLADGVYISGTSKNNKVISHTVTNSQDDAYSCTGIGERDESLAPKNNIFSSSTAENCNGALVCLQGSLNCIAENLIGKNVSTTAFKVGNNYFYSTTNTTQGSQAVESDYTLAGIGKNSTINNCHATTKNLFPDGEITQSYWCLSFENSKTENINIINSSVVRENTDNTCIMRINYTNKLNISNCKFENYIHCIKWCENVEIENNYFNLIDMTTFLECKNLLIANNIIYNQMKFIEQGFQTVHLSNCEKTKYIGNITDKSNDNPVNVDLTSYKTLMVTNFNDFETDIPFDYQIGFNVSTAKLFNLKYNGVFEDLKGLSASAFVNGQLVLKNNALYINKNGTLTQV